MPQTRNRAEHHLGRAIGVACQQVQKYENGVNPDSIWEG
jgi:hypothetical protein